MEWKGNSRLTLNIRVDSLITRDVIGQQYLQYLKPYPCYGGLDLAAVNDLTAFVLVWPIKEELYVYPWFWIPDEDLAGRSKRDGVRYDMWSSDGYVELTSVSVTDWRYVTERIKQLAKVFKIHEVGFDQYGARDTVADLMDAGINRQSMSHRVSCPSPLRPNGFKS